MTTNNTGSVLLERAGHIAYLTLNRPEALNALDVPMSLAFLRACEELAADSSVRVVVLRGAGRAFGVGGDIHAMAKDPSGTALTLLGNMNPALELLAGIDAPVIASVHGVVAGGSLSMILGCDLAIAAEGTRFNMAYANIGASVDLSCSWSLPRLVGLRKAMQIALLSETFDSAEAQDLGVVNLTVPAEALGASTDALAARIAKGPTLAYGRMKRLMRQSLDNTLSKQLKAEREEFLSLINTLDFKEGLRAFIEKRQSNFTGT
ncbi:enoyl-CoA hydratase-related protein [Marinobacter sp. 71-i]|uniref:Enoyl-CoA hydratase-related protein n=1 Tax=Marinobacter iranensis TaxID=2962607 RepID=A0ABT5YAW9_9GAMM|nr:enoyl-CoA hydratase-related protein [Marinobacter iranensis]MDF0750831.1 enoyl-CoA hydratase-related protein [Marinobacter iranensis]